jgi:hypothetical protein
MYCNAVFSFVNRLLLFWHFVLKIVVKRNSVIVLIFLEPPVLLSKVNDIREEFQWTETT